MTKASPECGEDGVEHGTGMVEEVRHLGVHAGVGEVLVGGDVTLRTHSAYQSPVYTGAIFDTRTLYGPYVRVPENAYIYTDCKYIG